MCRGEAEERCLASDPSAAGRIPFRLLRRHFPWVLIVFFGALSLLAAGNVLDKLREWRLARQIHAQVDANALINQAVDELQKERGISSGLLASGGARFGAELADQYTRADPALATLRVAMAAQAASRGEDTPAPELAALDGLGELRRLVGGRVLSRDVAVARYTDIVQSLFQLMLDTAQLADGRLLRAQLALIAFLQAKEMAGQERALLTTMLAAGNFDPGPRREALLRIQAQKEVFIRQFFGLVDPALREAYWDMEERPLVLRAEAIRRKIVYIADAPRFMADALPSAEEWFAVATQKIDAMKSVEVLLGESVARGAREHLEFTQHTLLAAVGLALLSCLLAAAGWLQVRRGQRLAENDLQLAASVFGDCAEAMVITDPQAVIVQANKAFSRMTGYTAADVIGQSMSLLRSDRHDATFFAAMWQDLLRHGSWEGEVWNRRRNGEQYPAQLSLVAVRDAQGAVANYIAMIFDLSQRRQSEQLIEQLRNHDRLTGLLNREAWQAVVARAVEGAAGGGPACAVLDIGVDRFRLINESLGHALGDEVLQEIAARLRAALPADAPLARPAGDRFAALLEDGLDSLDARCQALLEAFIPPMHPGGHELGVTVSIGVACAPDDDDQAAGLLMKAEAAMNRAKQQGQGSWRRYAADMSGEGVRLLRLERMLRRALEQGEFELHYQPQVDACGGGLVGVEALLRWHSAELGMVSPVQFIPVAEQTGLIVPIGAWVLRAACWQARRWQASLGRELPVAVNLSARQFADAGLLDEVEAVLRETGLPGRLLELEITEGLLVEDPAGAAETLRRLQTLGVRVAIDDFGTGYSSLAYLKTFPLDRLKMDRSFVRDLEHNDSDRAIARAIVALARNLNIEVVAEGVETARQRDFLAGIGCHVLQGYLHGRPMPGDALAQLVRDGALPLEQAPGNVLEAPSGHA